MRIGSTLEVIRSKSPCLTIINDAIWSIWIKNCSNGCSRRYFVKMG